MDKKIMLTLLLNQVQIMDAMAHMITISGLKDTRDPNANKMADIAEQLVKRSNGTKDLMSRYL